MNELSALELTNNDAPITVSWRYNEGNDLGHIIFGLQLALGLSPIERIATEEIKFLRQIVDTKLIIQAELDNQLQKTS